MILYKTGGGGEYAYSYGGGDAGGATGGATGGSAGTHPVE